MKIITWEYLVKEFLSNKEINILSEKLNEFGAKGYELVAFAEIKPGFLVIIFKRPNGFIDL
jgi:hypothetical protein